jgi:hypothetical protein
MMMARPTGWTRGRDEPMLGPMAKSDKPLHLALFLNAREHWTRGIARGAVRTLRAAADWEPFIIDAPALIAHKLQEPCLGRRWAGVIGHFYPEQHPLLVQLRAAGVPVVNVSAPAPPSGVMWIHNDDPACGALAARHFLERGHRHFAFVGISGAAISAERLRGFAGALAAEGVPEVLDVSLEPGGDGPNHQRLAEALSRLPRPCAVFACNDVRAGHCLRAAQLAGIVVPEELAILGVDDDDLYCNMAPVALSSVCPQAHPRPPQGLADSRGAGRPARRLPAQPRTAPAARGGQNSARGDHRRTPPAGLPAGGAIPPADRGDRRANGLQQAQPAQRRVQAALWPHPVAGAQGRGRTGLSHSRSP